MSTLAEWALYYGVKRRFPVFPVKPRSKQPPLTAHGCLDASTDEAQIREWWAKTPNANIALRTGIAFWVLDVDASKGGFDSRDTLELAHGKLRPTLSQVTGGKGYQYLYALPEQAVIKNAENVCGWAGIDVRGENGYIIAPPSIHPSGNKYFWDGSDWEREEIAPCDPWLAEAILHAHSNGSNGQRKRFELPEKIPYGQQHKYLVSLAGRMRANYMGYEEIVAALWEVNNTRCEKPGPRAHIEQYARSVCNYVPGTNVPGPQHAPAPQARPAEPPKAALTLSQLLALEVKPPQMLIENLLPQSGATLVVGSQKIGKTIFAAQTAIAVATAHALFDYYRVLASGPVIIVEQDDPAGERSFKDMFTRAQVSPDAPIYFHSRSPYQIGPEFIAWLESEIQKYKALLVVLDSYTALRPRHRSGNDVVQSEREEITSLDALGKRLDCLMMLLHHESTTARSSYALDWDAKLAGTYGLSMASESQISLSRFRDLPMSSRERLVRSRGRHQVDHQLAVRLNPLHFFEFVLEGDAAPFYHLLADLRRDGIDSRAFSAKEFAQAAGVSLPTAYRHLSLLVYTSLVTHADGAYTLRADVRKALR